ncbi:hypothetical protein ACCS33_11325 [Rhizobium ruizarguesonis]|uniref:hypothetical protein n=1 Tax=Rhizobium ruizarguesonis TaxID=2081791 RepID=UPI0013EE4F24|nr:hypothetical protein [Rhizobium ruizarguesonis]
MMIQASPEGIDFSSTLAPALTMKTVLSANMWANSFCAYYRRSSRGSLGRGLLSHGGFLLCEFERRRIGLLLIAMMTGWQVRKIAQFIIGF